MPTDRSSTSAAGVMQHVIYTECPSAEAVSVIRSAPGAWVVCNEKQSTMLTTTMRYNMLHNSMLYVRRRYTYVVALMVTVTAET